MGVSRWVGVLYLALTLGWNPVAPPEHVHESDEAGTHQILVHRHADGHFGVIHTEGHREIAETDVVMTLDATFVLAPSPSLIRPHAVTSLVLDEPPLTDSRVFAVDDIERLTHSPPRTPTGLRAPPLASRL